MASTEFDDHWTCSTVDSFDGSLNIQIEEGNSSGGLPLSASASHTISYDQNIPKPPPVPSKINLKTKRYTSNYHYVPRETKEMWEKLFIEGYGADVHIITQDKLIIPAHFNVLSVASPVLGSFLRQSRDKNGIRYIKISGVPHDAVHVFIRFLYSSCYDAEEMKKFILHLLVLSHSYSIHSLKKVCISLLEQSWLNKENVIDVLQLARECDASRLAFICIQMVVREFKTISSTEGWKVMKRANPLLEQELLELLVEADSRKQDRLKKFEERKMYLQLYEAMEALLHICRDGCNNIGPRDKMLKGNQVTCSFPACKGLEILVRHFQGCRTRVPGGCVQCKRMWQILELHSRMCNEPDLCKVPLCRHFKEKMRQQTKKEETKWKLLVSKVIAAKNALGPFSSQRAYFL
ncbi:hypothetical protein Leryth_001749 [Lithospermum erythrorhizon]|nr:hypothetical protein Leryth_001749 [Lithospermum erythrorhizon]